MTVHVVPAGVSLSENLQFMSESDCPKIHDIEDRWSKDLMGVGERGWSTSGRLGEIFGVRGSKSSLREDFKSLAKEYQVDRWSASMGLSAELDSLRAVRSLNNLRSNLVILLTGRSDEGRACALWNAIAVAQGDVDKVTYISQGESSNRRGNFFKDMHRHLPESPRGGVLVVQIDGLNAKVESEFTKAMEGMGYLMRALTGDRDLSISRILKGNRGQDPEKVNLHLTGGYRATIPFLVAVAEWMNSLGENCEAVVLPKDSHRTVSLPLRRLDETLVRAELDDFTPDGKAAAVPQGAYLDGYAYERESVGARLTPFGHGMRALFRTGR